jgi:hypothetical protein
MTRPRVLTPFGDYYGYYGDVVNPAAAGAGWVVERLPDHALKGSAPPLRCSGWSPRPEIPSGTHVTGWQEPR